MTMTRLLSPALLIALYLVCCGCSRKALPTRTVTLREVTRDSVALVPIPGDSSVIRLAIDSPSSIRELGRDISDRMRLSWSVTAGQVVIKATTLPRTVQLPSRIITREIPVEVPVVREVKASLSWWQKNLMGAGVMALLITVLSLARKWII